MYIYVDAYSLNMIYNGVDNSFITIDTTIKEDAIEEGALDILFIIKPEWKRKNIITKVFLNLNRIYNNDTIMMMTMLCNKYYYTQYIF